MVSEQDIRRALASLAGPDGKPLGASDALGIAINGGKVYLTITADPSKAAAFEPGRKAAEEAVKALAGVEAVLVMLTGERPQGAGPGPKAQAATQKAGVPGIKHIISVASGKGGVGKSTTAVNLALGLSGLGLKVGILDADIYGPSLPKLFALKSKPQVLEGRILKPLEAFGIKIMSIGFLIEDDAAVIWRGPMVMSALQQMLREVAWGDLDVLVVDMPPGTGDAQLTMAQAVPLAGAVIVSTPQDLALIDARRGIAMFKRVDVPILGLVENMSYFLCPECGHRSDIFGHGGARHEAERLGIPFLGEIPLELDIRERSDAGLPVVATAPDTPYAARYRAIAEAVKQRLEGEGAARRAAPRIVMD